MFEYIYVIFRYSLVYLSITVKFAIVTCLRTNALTLAQSFISHLRLSSRIAE